MLDNGGGCEGDVGGFGPASAQGSVDRSGPYDNDGRSAGGSPVSLNEDGLPMRPESEACLYYLNTGTCRSGTQCIFHHPPKVDREAELNKSLRKAGMLPPDSGMTIAPMPEALPPDDVALGDPPAPEETPSSTISGQMAGIMEKLEALQGASPPEVEATPEKPAQSKVEQPAAELPRQVEWNEDGLPIRYGAEKCGHYLRTGKCQPSCRFSHPHGMGGIMNNPGFAANPAMVGALMTEGALAMRPGREQCPFLARTGSCPFGPECRFDHSRSKSESNPQSLIKPAAPVSQKKNRGLGGTRAKRPPPRGF